MIQASNAVLGRSGYCNGDDRSHWYLPIFPEDRDWHFISWDKALFFLTEKVHVLIFFLIFHAETKRILILFFFCFLFKKKKKIPYLELSGWLEKITYLPYVFGQASLSKVCKSRRDAAKCGISSGSTVCLPLIQVFLDTTVLWQNFRTGMVRSWGFHKG